MKTTLNTELLKIDYKTDYEVVYTMESLLNYVTDSLNLNYKIYHNSDSGSVYAYLTNTSKNDVYVSLRVSNHSVLNRGFVASTGGADEEIVFESHHDIDDLNEMIEDLELMIEDYII